MRRIVAALLVPLGACAVLAGCGGSASPKADSNHSVTVSGKFDAKPTVKIPALAPTSGLVINTLVKGNGATLDSTSAALADVALYKWSGKTHSLVESTFGVGPQMIPVGDSLPGLVTALKGAKVGSRIEEVMPPKYGYGSSGNSQLGITGTDTLVWVIDLLQRYSVAQGASGTHMSDGGGALPAVSAAAGKAPTVTIPTKTTPPAKLSVTTLIKGSGPKLAKGDTAVVEYAGYVWRTGKLFSSTWPSSSDPEDIPFSFVLGGQVIPGWNDGLTGVTVGSRVMLVIPPSLGYGPEGGEASAGIEKTDTLVFVVDVLGMTTSK